MQSKTLNEYIEILESLRDESEFKFRQALKTIRRKRRRVDYKRRPIPPAWIWLAYVNQRALCNRCEKLLDWERRDGDKIVGDHWIPLAKGGRHSKTNIVALHRSCNARKSDADPVKESKRTGKLITEQIP